MKSLKKLRNTLTVIMTAGLVLLGTFAVLVLKDRVSTKALSDVFGDSFRRIEILSSGRAGNLFSKSSVAWHLRFKDSDALLPPGATKADSSDLVYATGAIETILRKP